MAEQWERREKRLVELVLPSGTWGPRLQRALYAAESEWREGRGLPPDGPVPPMAVTVHAEGGELLVRFEVIVADGLEQLAPEPVGDQLVEAPEGEEVPGDG